MLRSYFMLLEIAEEGTKSGNIILFLIFHLKFLPCLPRFIGMPETLVKTFQNLMVAQSFQPSSPGDWGVDFNPTGRPQGPQLHAGLTIIRFLPYSHFSKSSMPLQCQIQCLTLHLSGVPTQGWSGPCLSGLCSSVSACFSLPSAFTSWVTSLRTDSFLSLTCISPNTRSVQQYLKKTGGNGISSLFWCQKSKIHTQFFLLVYFS